MKNLLLLLSIACFCGIQLRAQESNVGIKINDQERYRFEDSRISFINPFSNIYIGDSAGYFDTAGIFNVFLGTRSGYYNTSGHRNTFYGNTAGFSNTTGFRNTYIGLSAGAYNTTGSCNTFIGRGAGFNNQTGDSNIFIGSIAGYDEMGSGKLYIDNTGTSDPLIYGDFSLNFLKFNAENVITTGEVRSNTGFNVSGFPGVNETMNAVTDIDFTQNKLKYRTITYIGGIATYISPESAWADSVGDFFFPCGDISVLGEFTGWSTNEQFMNRDPGNPSLFSDTVYISEESNIGEPYDIIEMKFRENANWTVNWGSDEFPSGTGYQYGPNIPVPLNPLFDITIYYIEFNCHTGEYTFTDISGN